MAQYVKVAGVDEIPVGKMMAVEAGHKRIVLCRHEDGFYAVADECSHDYAPISTGRMRDHEIVCPRHGARFDIRTGDVKAPPAVVGVERYETKVENGNVYVLVE